MELKWNEDFEAPSLVASYEWSAPYADEVHMGLHYIGGRGVARPWTTVAISETNCPKVFADHYRGDIRVAFAAFAHDMAGRFSDTIDNHNWSIASDNPKQYRPGVPTWQKITDSGALRDSLQMEVRDA
ncbi:MAG: hypothetical protein KME42_14090 [Tildeniella nuda ZEHNDER 1965/U140]|jgi:hypothetical protein|nr:hypothetical protein [Tildeniella nuda ZEHNDER 1965/U140]